MRIDNLKNDAQLIIYKLISSISDSLVSACSVVFGWPDIGVNTKFEKALIYILSPDVIDKDTQFGGLNRPNMEMIIGCWNDRNTGGSARCDQIISYLINFFDNKHTCHESEFDVTIGTTSYSGTTLASQSLFVVDYEDMGDIPTEEINETRKELKLYLET